VFYQAVHVRLLDYVQLPSDATVLEIGCGTGKLLNRLAQSNPSLVGIGVDLASGMVDQAKRKTPFGDRLQFIEANVTALPFDDAEFDAVFCAISFLHYPDPDRALSEVARVAKPGGRFYLADFTPPNWAPSDTILHDVSPAGVRFYNAQARAALGERAGLSCDRHAYLLGPVMMSQFTRPST
jgi:ubiquinone/menaquinone biosynthesis C-methylase UbiE